MVTVDNVRVGCALCLVAMDRVPCPGRSCGSYGYPHAHVRCGRCSPRGWNAIVQLEGRGVPS